MQRRIYHLIGKEQGNVKAGREQERHTLFTQQQPHCLAGLDPFGQAGIPARPSVYFYKNQVCLSASVMKSPPPESFWEASVKWASSSFLLELSHSHKQLQVGQVQAPKKLLYPPSQWVHPFLKPAVGLSTLAPSQQSPPQAKASTFKSITMSVGHWVRWPPEVSSKRN